MRPLPLLLAAFAATLAACGAPTDSPTDDSGGEDAIDLVTPLGADAVRAGVVTDPAALPGGLGAEGRPGDVVLVNDTVRFVVQAADRSTMGLVPFGGGILDADLVREDGTPGGDLVVDWMPAMDVRGLPDPSTVTVIDDGIESGEAVVEVAAKDIGFAYLSAVFEDVPDPSQGASIVTRYTLRPGTPLLEVTTTVTAGDTTIEAHPGDMLQSFPGITSSWVPGMGRVVTPGAARDAVMLVHDERGTTMGLFASDTDGSARPEPSLDLLNALVSFTSLFEEDQTIAPGEAWTWTRWWGVGPDPATLTDAWLAARDADTRTVTAQTSPAVPGVRVTVLVDDLPYTLAITDADGIATADVPSDAVVRFVADGSGSRLHDDLPEGAGTVAPLGHADLRDAGLTSLRDGATPTPHARGWGRAEATDGGTLTLTPPGTLTVTASGSDAFQVRVRPSEGGVTDDAYSLRPPSGRAAVGHARNGRVDMPMEPGTYDVLVWAGTRFEVHEEEVTVVSDETVTVDATDLTKAWSADHWFLADTHVHAAPSFDGKLTPADRAMVEAGVGIDLWFASEHDVGVDHTELVTALGLEDRLFSVGSVEITPWVRGHVNVFPWRADPDDRAGGAFPWWEDLPDDTPDQFDDLLTAMPGVMVQINHPFSPGMPQFAGWSEEGLATPSAWWGGFAAVEVIVPGQTPRGQDLYVDLAARGIFAAATGSTDSHDHLTNDPGLLATWIFVDGADTAGDVTDDGLVAAFEGRHTVATNGPFVMTDPLPGSLVEGDTTLTVTVDGPSWIVVDTLELWKDGALAATATPVDGEAIFELAPDDDASFVVVATGSQGMQPLNGRTPWAVASAIWVDVEGDGYTPAKAPF